MLVETKLLHTRDVRIWGYSTRNRPQPNNVHSSAKSKILFAVLLLTILSEAIFCQKQPHEASQHDEKRLEAAKKMIDNALKPFEDTPALQLCVALSNKLDQKRLAQVMQKSNILPAIDQKDAVQKVSST
jgi:hypothetical protein